MSIYSIYWNNVVENLTPSFWRKTKAGLEAEILPNLRSVIKPIQDLSDTLLSFQQNTVRYLDYTGQHLALEAYLNDTYDVADRRIFITENNVINGATTVDLYLQSEVDPTPLSIYRQGETAPVPFSLYLQGETVFGLYNFTINIPLAVAFDSDVVTKQVKRYSEAAKTFNIITF